MVKKTLLVGIAGGTGTGKTTLAHKLVQGLHELHKKEVSLISQDWYYRDLSYMPLELRHQHNFDHPDAIDHELLASHLKQLAAGEAVDAPVYDFKTHTRKEETKRIEPHSVCIIEGLHLLVYPEIREILDIKIYMETSDDLRFIRRLLRDISERGRTPKMVVEQYISTVRPMHLEFIEPSRRYADLIVPWDAENPVAVEVIISRIREFLG